MDFQVWNARTKEVFFTGEHSNKVMGCDFSPDSKLLVSASYDKTLKVASLQSFFTLPG